MIGSQQKLNKASHVSVPLGIVLKSCTERRNYGTAKRPSFNVMGPSTYGEVLGWSAAIVDIYNSCMYNVYHKEACPDLGRLLSVHGTPFSRVQYEEAAYMSVAAHRMWKTSPRDKAVSDLAFVCDADGGIPTGTCKGTVWPQASCPSLEGPA